MPWLSSEQEADVMESKRQSIRGLFSISPSPHNEARLLAHYSERPHTQYSFVNVAPYQPPSTLNHFALDPIPASYDLSVGMPAEFTNSGIAFVRSNYELFREITGIASLADQPLWTDGSELPGGPTK